MRISVVVPVYNSAGCLPELVRRLGEALPRIDPQFEVILVDDDSRDASWATIRDLCPAYPFLRGVRLRKNAGQDNAIMAGLSLAEGDAVVIMDDDLQHDPDDIPALWQGLSDGEYDVVYGRFKAMRQARWKILGSWLNDRLAVRVLGKPKDIYMSPFKIIDRAVVREVLRYDGPYSYVDGLLFTVTSRIGQVEVSHHPRFAGRSNYDLIRSIRVWLKLATSFSIVPLRLATLAGGLMSVGAFMLGIFFLLQALLLERMPAGWPSLIVTVLFLGGIQLVGIGAVGEYIGRIYITQNKRPQFTIREQTGGKAPHAE